MPDLSIKKGPPKRAELQGEWVEETLERVSQLHGAPQRIA
jgi:hypothetical protein